jgi:glycosyltransferase involved in cell wall biosynthesis
VFLEAARRVLERHPAACFRIVGDGPRRAELESMAADLGIAARVEFLGIRPDVDEIVRRSDVLALSSHPYRETLPVCVLEAMASGVPAAATDVGSVRDIIEDGRTGRVVRPGDPAALAEAVSGLLADPARRAAMGRAAREEVLSRYSRDAMIDGYQDLIEELSR